MPKKRSLQSSAKPTQSANSQNSNHEHPLYIPLVDYAPESQQNYVQQLSSRMAQTEQNLNDQLRKDFSNQRQKQEEYFVDYSNQKCLQIVQARIYQNGDTFVYFN